jgi:phytoene synthase
MTPVTELVRAHDPDRYFCGLFAPAAGREALMTLYAFNHELARAEEVAREPGLSLIRLQWWREVIEGARRRHEVAGPLGALIDAGVVPVALLASMIEAREDALGETPGDFVDLMRRGPGALAAAGGAVLGAAAEELEALVRLGAGCGVAGVLRNQALTGWPGGWRGLADRQVGEGLLGSPARWRRDIIAAALPAVLARRDLARRLAVRRRGAGDFLAVLGAVARRTV